MGIFTLFSYSARPVEVSATGIDQKPTSDAPASQPTQPVVDKPIDSTTEKPETSTVVTKEISLPTSSRTTPPLVPKIVISKPPTERKSLSKPPTDPVRPQANRFSLRPFSFSRDHVEHKPVLSAVQEREKKTHVTAAFLKRSAEPKLSNSDKQAKKSALVVRFLIIGPTAASPQLTITDARPRLDKIKSQLMQPKSANKVIAQLRALPISDALVDGKPAPAGPIHAVCLAHSDNEVDKAHFAVLERASGGNEQGVSLFGGSVAIDDITAMFSKMNIVSLITSPDLGLGQPGSGNGILSGAVPTAETVLQGFEQITPQLMALGYATGRAILPDHAGVFPPTDRMTVLTYWWGLELVLPPPSLEHLANAQSIAGTVVNFLTALSMINNGAREILPFVRYIAQFIEFEFNVIKRQDQGRGVVCAATWIMPAALVPRPWDFPDPPASILPTKPSLPISSPPSQPLVPPTTESPQPGIISPSLPTFADSIVRAYADSVHFQTVGSPAKVSVAKNSGPAVT